MEKVKKKRMGVGIKWETEKGSTWQTYEMKTGLRMKEVKKSRRGENG